MPLLTIHHKTEYRYAYPVAFGEHRIMLRPRDGHDLRVLSSQLEIAPEPASLRWIHDVFGNSVAIATFEARAATLSVTLTVTVEQHPAEPFALTPVRLNASATSGWSGTRWKGSPWACPTCGSRDGKPALREGPRFAALPTNG